MNKIIAVLVLLAIIAFKSDALRSASTVHDLALADEWDLEGEVSIFFKY